MLRIDSVQPGSSLVEPARALFAAYRDFLETIESTHCFDFKRYAVETAELPDWYTRNQGELLLAFVEDSAAGCIAFRVAEKEPSATREIKRLFVLPDFRQQGIARALIGEALLRAKAHGFARAVLDTDVVSMPLAYATYRSFGFEEYKPDGLNSPPSLRFLERPLS